MTSLDWIMILGMLAVTFGVRYVLWAAADRFRLPEVWEHALGYVPPAVLTAITIPAVLMPGGTGMDFSIRNPYLAGAVVACLAGLFSKRLLVVIVVGIAVFLAWSAMWRMIG